MSQNKQQQSTSTAEGIIGLIIVIICIAYLVISHNMTSDHLNETVNYCAEYGINSGGCEEKQNKYGITCKEDLTGFSVTCKKR